MGEHRPLLDRVGRHARLGGTHLDGKRDQSLLGPVVQVALDATACLVGSGDDPGA
jgi:hypothetical protein